METPSVVPDAVVPDAVVPDEPTYCICKEVTSVKLFKLNEFN